MRFTNVLLSALTLLCTYAAGDLTQENSVRCLGDAAWTRTWNTAGHLRFADISVDGVGNVYIGGSSRGAVVGKNRQIPAESNMEREFDAFVLKMDTDGELVWNAQWGSGRKNEISAMALDAEGSVYITGAFEDSIQLDSRYIPSTQDAVFLHGTLVLKMASDGMIQWLDRIADSYWAGAILDLCLDDAGCVYLVGKALAGFRLARDENGDVLPIEAGRCFLCKLDCDGRCLWGKPSTDSSEIWIGCAATNEGDVCVASLSCAGSSLSRYDSEGNLLWAVSWQDTPESRVQLFDNSLSIDEQGDVYITGRFAGKLDFDVGEGIDFRESHGGWDVFLLKLNSSGEHQWARTWGSEWNDSVHAIGLGVGGVVCVTGEFSGLVDFDPANSSEAMASGGDQDEHQRSPSLFLNAFDRLGEFQWLVAGPDSSSGECVAIGETNDVYLAGIIGERGFVAKFTGLTKQ